MNNSTKKILILLVILAVGTGVYYLYHYGIFQHKTIVEKPKQKIIINEAARTLLYLPMYHALEEGIFAKNGLDVQVVTGGTATTSFAAMTSGEAQFSLADPMYVPISNEKNANTRVVAQVVSKIAIWGITMDTTIKTMSKINLRGKIISTHNKPMSAYTYTIKTIKDLGLDPEKDVEVLQNKPGNEIAPMLLRKAEFAMTIEPSVSIAVSKGAKIILSYPQILGEQILTGLMAKQDYIEQHREIVLAVLKACQESLDDIYAHPNSALKTALKYFPQQNPEVITTALKHVMDEGVIPHSILMTEESWNKAIDVRVKAGDLKSVTSREQNVRIDLIQEALLELK